MTSSRVFALAAVMATRGARGGDGATYGGLPDASKARCGASSTARRTVLEAVETDGSRRGVGGGLGSKPMRNDEFDFRVLDLVAVKGKSRAGKVFGGSCCAAQRPMRRVRTRPLAGLLPSVSLVYGESVIAAFASAARGTEVALREELRDLKFPSVRADRGGVHFAARDMGEIGRACLESRIAVRVLMPLAEIEAHDERALYDGVRAIDWRPYFSSRHTLSVSSTARASTLSHTQFIAQKGKDAIVDQLRDARGARPDVDRDDPDVRVYLHLVRNRATVYLDASGESLHRRGWRPRIGGAPLKETLAAAVLRLSGWDRKTPLHDPMCGSGTLAVEADLWARDVAPGILSPRFGFERWASHDATIAAKMSELRAAAKVRVAGEGPDILGSDIDAGVVARARGNAKEASSRARFEVAGIDAMAPLRGGLVVTNPPYGERLEGDEQLYRAMAAAFDRCIARGAGSTVAILSGTPAVEQAMQIRPLRSIPLWNGPIECRLLVYGMR